MVVGEDVTLAVGVFHDDTGAGADLVGHFEAVITLGIRVGLIAAFGIAEILGNQIFAIGTLWKKLTKIIRIDRQRANVRPLLANININHRRLNHTTDASESGG